MEGYICHQCFQVHFVVIFQFNKAFRVGWRILRPNYLTHWGRVTHICVGKLTIIGSDNGLSPERRQAIIWTNAGILLIGPLGTNFSEILIESQTFSLKKMRLKMSSAKCCSFRLGLNVLIPCLLLRWLIASPAHSQAWCRLHNLDSFMGFFNHIYHHHPPLKGQHVKNVCYC